jgi:uncharacterized protein YegL
MAQAAKSESRPVYFVVDRSAAMGSHLESIRGGLASVAGSLSNDLSLLESGRLGLITYAESANEAIPPTELMHFQAPSLAIDEGGAPSLSNALDSLNASIASHREDDSLGKPLVFVLAGGKPSESEVSALKRKSGPLVDPNAADVVAIGCGAKEDAAVLRQVATQQDRACVLEDTSTGGWAKFFKALSTPMSDAMQGRKTVRMEPVLDLVAFAPEATVPKATVRQQPKRRAPSTATTPRQHIPRTVTRRTTVKQRQPTNLTAFDEKATQETVPQGDRPAMRNGKAKHRLGAAFGKAEETTKLPQVARPESPQKAARREGTVAPSKEKKPTAAKSPTQKAKRTSNIFQSAEKRKSPAAGAEEQKCMAGWATADSPRTAVTGSAKTTHRATAEKMSAEAWELHSAGRKEESPPVKQAPRKKTEPVAKAEPVIAKPEAKPAAPAAEEKKQAPVAETPQPVETAPTQAKKTGEEPAVETPEPVEDKPVKAKEEKKAKPKRAKRRKRARRKPVEEEGLMELE